jgi:DNA adenine methylase
VLVKRLLGVFNEDGSYAQEFKQRFFFNSRDLFLVNSVVFYHGNDFEEIFDKCRKIEDKAVTVDEKLQAKNVTRMIWERYEQYHGNPQLWDAVMFFIMMKCSYSATGKSWASKPVNYESVARLINAAAKQLQCVIIENKDCIDLIKFHDGKDVVFYCDPPYYMAENLYNDISFGTQKHQELHDTLKACEGNVIVSYNDCGYIRELYSDGWCIVSLSRPHNMVLHNGGGQLYNELLIANYDIGEQLAEGRQMSLFDNDFNNFGGNIL